MAKRRRVTGNGVHIPTKLIQMVITIGSLNGKSQLNRLRHLGVIMSDYQLTHRLQMENGLDGFKYSFLSRSQYFS